MQIGSKSVLGGPSCKKLTVFLRLNFQKMTVYPRYDCIPSVLLYALCMAINVDFGAFQEKK